MNGMLLPIDLSIYQCIYIPVYVMYLHVCVGMGSKVGV
jgi:hypothetical protein